MPILSVRSLAVALDPHTPLLDGISFSIEAGETLALLGESGCGKSMTALALMRLLPAAAHLVSGEVRLAGQELLALPEREMCAVRGGRMAMIFQEPGLSLNPVLTVGQQIAEVLRLHRGMTPAQAQQRGIALLEQVGIADAARRYAEYPFQMSGGMKQRVMIAMALAGEPQLLIADEPTTALDVTIQAQVLQLLRELQQRRSMAMLLITHDLAVVAENAQRVAVMYAGQIVEQGSRSALFAAPLHPYTRKLFAALPESRVRGQRLAAIPGTVPLPGRWPRGCRFAPRCDEALPCCDEEAPPWVDLAPGQGVLCHLYRLGQRPVWGAERPMAGVSEATGATTPLLEVRGLEVHFPIRKGILQRTVGRVRAVDGVDLRLDAGRTLALVGESGCGKTTVGKALLHLVRPSAGQAQFAGMALLPDFPKAARAGMQMVFQDPYASLNPRMRIADILLEGMQALAIGKKGEERMRRIETLLEQVGLPQGSQWRYPHEFSGGQRQRIAIARALAVQPRLLICDEPTSALDVSVQAQILNLLRELQQELQLSYLFITHNLAVVDYLAHEVAVMYLGRIVERGTVAEVMQEARHPYTQALLAAMPRIEKTGSTELRLAGELPSPADPPRGCHFHPRCPKVMPVCRSAYPAATALSASHEVSCHLFSGSPPA